MLVIFLLLRKVIIFWYENGNFFMSHFKEWDFKLCHCIFLDYKKLLNFKQNKRQIQGSCFLWDNNNSFLDNGIRSQASIKGTEAQQLLAAGQWAGTVHWDFNCYFALGHALLFQLNLWCTESLVPFFLHLIT